MANSGDQSVNGSRCSSGVGIPFSVENGTGNGYSFRSLFGLPGALFTQLDENAESEAVSQAGDIGDRELSRRGSRAASLRFSMDRGAVVPVNFPEELLEHGFWSRDPSKLSSVSRVSSFTSEIITLPPNDLKDQEVEKGLPPLWEYVSCLVYLAVFAIIGVLSRYLLQKLFGPGVANVTSDHGVLYLDLPSNMVGSFLMGWFGVVFRGDISRVSNPLAIGLSTGYLGSLTAFSGWNQKMLELSIQGHWVFVVLGFIIGLFLSAYCIQFGIETAKGFRWLLMRTRTDSSASNWSVNYFKRGQLIVLLLLILMWGGMWAAIGVLAKKEFKNGGHGAQLWLACFVGPFGVWIRWWLARLNGCGLGKSGLWKWIPFGTLAANVSGACLMATLAIVKKAVNTKNCDTVASGLQFGFLGCLSTVPAFMAEFNAMRQSSQPWRAYAYALITIGMSFGLGTLIYSVPVWAKGYNTAITV